MVNRMRHNRSHRGNVRSHHALKNVGGSKCPECGSVCATHRACANCGKYRGRVVIDVHAKIAKKDKKSKTKKGTAK
jgi:large subunit ribosomal protein L32